MLARPNPQEWRLPAGPRSGSRNESLRSTALHRTCVHCGRKQSSQRLCHSTVGPLQHEHLCGTLTGDRIRRSSWRVSNMLGEMLFAELLQSVIEARRIGCVFSPQLSRCRVHLDTANHIVDKMGMARGSSSRPPTAAGNSLPRTTCGPHFEEAIGCGRRAELLPMGTDEAPNHPDDAAASPAIQCQS